MREVAGLNGTEPKAYIKGTKNEQSRRSNELASLHCEAPALEDDSQMDYGGSMGGMPHQWGPEKTSEWYNGPRRTVEWIRR